MFMRVIILGAGSRLAQSVLKEMVSQGDLAEIDIFGIAKNTLTLQKSGNMQEISYYNFNTLFNYLELFLLGNETKIQPKLAMLVSARTRHGETLGYLETAVRLIEYLKQKGLVSVVFISSLAGTMVTRTQGWQYHAEKGAEQSVARWLSVEHANHVRVNVVQLYHVEPDLKNESYPERPLRIKELASCITWLFSDAGSALSGQLLTLGTLRGKVIEPLETFHSISS